MNNSDFVFDVLSIIGAMAWLPPLVTWLHQRSLKTRLSIIVEPQIEIGFTTIGPILNCRVAILCEEKQTLINKIEVVLTHNDKDSYHILWDWFEEDLIQLPEAIGSAFKKNQRAIAIFLIENQLVEKKIGFQSLDFKGEALKLQQAIQEEISNILAGGKQTDEIKTRKCYNELINLYRHSFIWKPGKYNARLIIRTKDRLSFSEIFNFSLRPLDVDVLQGNIELCNKSLEKTYFDGGIDVPNTAWKFVNLVKYN